MNRDAAQLWVWVDYESDDRDLLETARAIQSVTERNIWYGLGLVIEHVTRAVLHTGFGGWRRIREAGDPSNPLSAKLVGDLPEGTIAPVVNLVLCDLLRDIVGDPSDRNFPSESGAGRPTGEAFDLAHQIYEDRRFERMASLGDVLEVNGTRDLEMVAHCRGPGPHARGCWVLDFILRAGEQRSSRERCAEIVLTPERAASPDASQN
jgi:hypothetical protein